MCMVMRNLNADFTSGTRANIVRARAACAWSSRPCTKARASHAMTSLRVHYIPRIKFKWQIKRNGRYIKRRHFPLRPGFAMTCRKLQGNTIEKVGLDVTSAPWS